MEGVAAELQSINHSTNKLTFLLTIVDNGMSAADNTLCFNYTRLGYVYSKP